VDRNEKIIESAENFVDEIRNYCNGIDSIIKLENTTGVFELNFKKIHFGILQELNTYFRKSRNDKTDHITLSKLKEIFTDLIYEFDNRSLIQESLFKEHITKNKEFLNGEYFLCEDIIDAIKDLYDHLEIEIEQREKRTDSHGRIDPRIDSSHCIDINTRFVIALFEQVLKNPVEIKNLSNSKKSVLLESLTGHKRKTFANNYSKYGAGSNQIYIDDANKLIESLLE